MPNIKNLKAWLPHRPRPISPTLIVLHATGGSTASGAIETLRDRGLSYHYIIEPNGTIWKGCPSAAVAFHAGNSYGPREKAAKISRKQNRAKEFTAQPTPCVNGYSIGIAFVNLDNGRDPYDQPQVQAAQELIAELRRAYSTLTHLTTHAIVSPGRKVDPLGFNLDSFAQATNLPIWRY